MSEGGCGGGASKPPAAAAAVTGGGGTGNGGSGGWPRAGAAPLGLHVALAGVRTAASVASFTLLFPWSVIATSAGLGTPSPKIPRPSPGSAVGSAAFGTSGAAAGTWGPWATSRWGTTDAAGLPLLFTKGFAIVPLPSEQRDESRCWGGCCWCESALACPSGPAAKPTALPAHLPRCVSICFLWNHILHR